MAGRTLRPTSSERASLSSITDSAPCWAEPSENSVELYTVRITEVKEKTQVNGNTEQQSAMFVNVKWGQQSVEKEEKPSGP